MITPNTLPTSGTDRNQRAVVSTDSWQVVLPGVLPPAGAGETCKYALKEYSWELSMRPEASVNVANPDAPVLTIVWTYKIDFSQKTETVVTTPIRSMSGFVDSSGKVNIEGSNVLKDSLKTFMSDSDFVAGNRDWTLSGFSIVASDATDTTLIQAAYNASTKEFIKDDLKQVLSINLSAVKEVSKQT